MAAVLLLIVSLQLSGAELKEETVDAFNRYVGALESRLKARWRGQAFLWSDSLSSREQLNQGAVLVAPTSGNGNIEIKGGMIQDWTGAILIPSADRGGGVVVECESVTLTRDVPFGMRALLSPIVKELPAEALRKSLQSTRKAVLNRR